jgi:hypothetical protein
MKNKECGNPYTPKMQQTAKRYRKQEFQAVKQGVNNKTKKIILSLFIEDTSESCHIT